MFIDISILTYHFHTIHANPIRIQKYASCSKECFILALIYIDRLIQRNNFLLTELNVHRVVITAILLAAKFFDDAYYNNAYYAKVGGVHVAEMNNLETQFLFKIDFSLRVLPEVFEKYSAELISHSSSSGLEAIENSTNEDLLRVPSVAEIKMSMNEEVRPAPVLGFPDSIEQVNAPRLEGCATAAATATISSPWGPIQASSSLAQQVQHVNQQPVYQQQQQAEASLDPLLSFPFPTLAPQVSATEQAQYPPPQNPIELDLYQNSSSHQGLVELGLAPPLPQGQVYIQQQSSSSSEFDQAINYNSNSSMMAVAAVAPMDGVSAVSQYHPVQQATTNTHGMPMQKYPEITPSPPLQHPPTSIHGAPMPFTVGTSSVQQELQENQHYYPIQGIGMALDQHQPSHLHQQISRPIAIGGRDSFPQDNSWSMLSNSGNRRTFGSTR